MTEIYEWRSLMEIIRTGSLSKLFPVYEIKSLIYTGHGSPPRYSSCTSHNARTISDCTFTTNVTEYLKKFKVFKYSMRIAENAYNHLHAFWKYKTDSRKTFNRLDYNETAINAN